jgi:hypothetical protein
VGQGTHWREGVGSSVVVGLAGGSAAAEAHFVRRLINRVDMASSGPGRVLRESEAVRIPSEPSH